MYKADGTILMEGSVNGYWSVRNGLLYEQSVFYGGLQAYEIIAINDQQLVYKGLTGDEKG
jgi:hypothetical protein